MATDRTTGRPGWTRVGARRRLTIPAEALLTADIRVGDWLRVEVHGNGEIILSRGGGAVDRYAGVFTGLYPPGELDQLRDEWE